MENVRTYTYNFYENLAIMYIHENLEKDNTIYGSLLGPMQNPSEISVITFGTINDPFPINRICVINVAALQITYAVVSLQSNLYIQMSDN